MVCIWMVLVTIGVQSYVSSAMKVAVPTMVCYHTLSTTVCYHTLQCRFKVQPVLLMHLLWATLGGMI